MRNILERWKAIRKRGTERKEERKEISRNIGRIDKEIRELQEAIDLGTEDAVREREAREDMPQWVTEQEKQGAELKDIGVEGKPSDIVLEQRIEELKSVRKELMKKLKKIR